MLRLILCVFVFLVAVCASERVRRWGSKADWKSASDWLNEKHDDLTNVDWKKTATDLLKEKQADLTNTDWEKTASDLLKEKQADLTNTDWEKTASDTAVWWKEWKEKHLNGGNGNFDMSAFLEKYGNMPLTDGNNHMSSWWKKYGEILNDKMADKLKDFQEYLQEKGCHFNVSEMNMHVVNFYEEKMQSANFNWGGMRDSIWDHLAEKMDSGNCSWKVIRDHESAFLASILSKDGIKDTHVDTHHGDSIEPHVGEFPDQLKNFAHHFKDNMGEKLQAFDDFMQKYGCNINVTQMFEHKMNFCRDHPDLLRTGGFKSDEFKEKFWKYLKEKMDINGCSWETAADLSHKFWEAHFGGKSINNTHHDWHSTKQEMFAGHFKDNVEEKLKAFDDFLKKHGCNIDVTQMVEHKMKFIKDHQELLRSGGFKSDEFKDKFWEYLKDKMHVDGCDWETIWELSHKFWEAHLESKATQDAHHEGHHGDWNSNHQTDFAGHFKDNVEQKLKAFGDYLQKNGCDMNVTEMVEHKMKFIQDHPELMHSGFHSEEFKDKFWGYLKEKMDDVDGCDWGMLTDLSHKFWEAYFGGKSINNTHHDWHSTKQDMFAGHFKDNVEEKLKAFAEFMKKHGCDINVTQMFEHKMKFIHDHPQLMHSGFHSEEFKSKFWGYLKEKMHVDGCDWEKLTNLSHTFWESHKTNEAVNDTHHDWYDKHHVRMYQGNLRKFISHFKDNVEDKLKTFDEFMKTHGCVTNVTEIVQHKVKFIEDNVELVRSHSFSPEKFKENIWNYLKGEVGTHDCKWETVKELVQKFMESHHVKHWKDNMDTHHTDGAIGNCSWEQLNDLKNEFLENCKREMSAHHNTSSDMLQMMHHAFRCRYGTIRHSGNCSSEILSDMRQTFAKYDKETLDIWIANCDGGQWDHHGDHHDRHHDRNETGYHDWNGTPHHDLENHESNHTHGDAESVDHEHHEHSGDHHWPDHHSGEHHGRPHHGKPHHGDHRPPHHGGGRPAHHGDRPPPPPHHGEHPPPPHHGEHPSPHHGEHPPHHGEHPPPPPPHHDEHPPPPHHGEHPPPHHGEHPPHHGEHPPPPHHGEHPPPHHGEHHPPHHDKPKQEDTIAHQPVSKTVVHPSAASEYNICYETKIMHFNTTILTKEPCENQDFPKKGNMSYNAQPIEHESSMPIQWCYKQKQLNVTVEVQYRKCCGGWTLGETGFCDVAVEGECTIGCLNGGTCVPGNDTCVCPQHFTGETCEIPVCKTPCTNGGRCTVNHTCECPTSFRGNQCQTPFCVRPCLNGGTCVPNGFHAQCMCTSQYHGRECEKAVEKPHRPTHGCRHSGHDYLLGDFFSVDNCKTCVCINPHAASPHEGTRCTTTACPVCEGLLEHVTGACCPACIKTLPKPIRHKNPTFDNCPGEGEVIVINLKGDATSATMVDRITAKDYLGHSANVSHSTTTFHYHRSPLPEHNLHTVVATASDHWSGTAECHFVVRVRDPIAPHFTHCPHDILVSIHDTAPYDPRPTAMDNVGLRVGMPRCERIDGINTHLVTCVAADFEGNEAFCQFMVRRFNDEDLKEANKKVYPEAQPSAQTQKLATVVGAPLAGVVFLVIIAVVLVILCRRRRKMVIERHVYDETYPVGLQHHDHHHGHHGHHEHHHHGHHHHPHDKKLGDPPTYTMPHDVKKSDLPPDYACVMSQEVVTYENGTFRPEDIGHKDGSNYTRGGTTGDAKVGSETEYTKIDLSKI